MENTYIPLSRRSFLKMTAATSVLASLGSVADAKNKIEQVTQIPDYCTEKAKSIPVIEKVDLVVVGGSSGAVEAAIAAARCGSKVFLVAGMPYLGDDICGSFMYQIDKRTEQVQTALARRIFLREEDPRESYPKSDESKLVYSQQVAPTPMQVKKDLEEALITNEVSFVYSSYATDILQDGSGNIAGVVIANRSGRQVIRCKGVIDATREAQIAEMCGLPFENEGRGNEQTYQFVVVGNEAKSHAQIEKCELLPFEFSANGKSYPIRRYTFKYKTDHTYAALMEAEQQIRSWTWDANQVDSSDLLWYTPSRHWKNGNETIKEVAESPFVTNLIRYNPDGFEKVPSTYTLPLSVACSDRIANLWVIGPCANVSREVAGWMMRPINAMTFGARMGEHAAVQLQGTSLKEVTGSFKSQKAGTYCGEIGERLVALRALKESSFVNLPEHSLPVLGHYDVVVMGGGTAGAPAGISSAMHGAKTLVLEYLHGLGGLTTLGLIGRYWDGYRGGYTAWIDQHVREMAPKDHPRQLPTAADNVVDWKMELYRKELMKYNADLWFGVLGCGALVHNGTVRGIVVATPYGRGVVLANVVIDSSGSADIAIAAGAQFEYTGKEVLAVQGAGLPRFNLNDYYNNTDWTWVDDTDVLDISRLYVQGKVKFPQAYDLGKLPQTRERRRIVGDYTVSVYDIMSHKRYKDTISYHESSFDTHGMTIDPLFTLNPPGKRHVIYDADVPLRALLPKGLENIIVTGLGASAHRDAMPVIRMQGCLQNQGYSVGLVASEAVKQQVSIRNLNIKKIQKILVEKEVLPSRVLTDQETKSYSDKAFNAAVTGLPSKGYEVLLTDKPRCINTLRKKWDNASKEEQLVYATTLCLLGEKDKMSVVAEAIQSYPTWDQGWHYTASGQFGECMSELDRLIMALGNTRDVTALPYIIAKAELLLPEDYFSHYRAISEAFEAIGSSDAVPVLHQLLTAPGIRFHDTPSYRVAQTQVVPYIHDITMRNYILKELYLAKSLFICGDKDGTAKEVLIRYAQGLEGHYARFAYEVLQKSI